MNHLYRNKQIILIAALTALTAGALVYAASVFASIGTVLEDSTAEETIASVQPEAEQPAQDSSASIYALEKVGDGYRYTGAVDGFSIVLPCEPTVETSFCGIRSELSWEHCRLYVYKEECADELAVQSYISYSNTFLVDKINFRDIQSRVLSVGAYSCTYAKWQREAFARVGDDLNCYSDFDIVVPQDGDHYCVYTLYFKYDETVSEKSLLDIACSFTVCEPTAAAPDAKLGREDGPLMDWQTQLAYEYLFAEDAPLRWGIFDYTTVSDMTRMQELEKALCYHFAVQVIYTNVLESGEPTVNKVPLTQALSDICIDSVPELTLQTVAREDGKNMVFCILQGEYDAFLHRYAASVAAYGKPVLFRLGNEMNGDWCPYSAFQAGRDPDVYLAFYRYVFGIFQQEGADNVMWVWNPNGVSFPNFKWNRDLLYYPGDEYVNIVGMTAYNTGTYYEGEKWTTFRDLYETLYQDYADTYKRPLMITEFACSGNGGSKKGWIADMFRILKQMPRIKVAVWWNGADYDGPVMDGIISRPYFLMESDGSMNAFARGLETPFSKHFLQRKE